MSAQLRIDGQDVAIRDETGRFHCEDDQLEADLNQLIEDNPIGGEIPNPAYFYAQKAIERFGGELVSYDPTLIDELIFPDDNDEGGEAA